MAGLENCLAFCPPSSTNKPVTSRDTMKELQEHFGSSLLDPIHRATILREAPAEGKLVYELDPQHRATHEYYTLSEYLIKYS